MAKILHGYPAGKQRGTHVSKKTGKNVIVERIENSGFIVKNLKGKVIAHYEKSRMGVFNEKYKSLRVPNEKNKIKE